MRPGRCGFPWPVFPELRPLPTPSEPSEKESEILGKIFEILSRPGMCRSCGGLADAGRQGFDDQSLRPARAAANGGSWLRSAPTPAVVERIGPAARNNALDIRNDVSLALFDNGEFIVTAGQRDAKAMLEDVLQIRAGKKESALKEDQPRPARQGPPRHLFMVTPKETCSAGMRLDKSSLSRPALKALDIRPASRSEARQPRGSCSQEGDPCLKKDRPDWARAHKPSGGRWKLQAAGPAAVPRG